MKANISLSQSVRIVKYFMDKGKTPKDLAGWLALSESFIKRVARGERNFTLAHVDRLEKVVGKSPFLLMLEAERDEVPEDLRQMYEDTLNFFRVSEIYKKDLDKILSRTKRRRTPRRGATSDDI